MAHNTTHRRNIASLDPTTTYAYGFEITGSRTSSKSPSMDLSEKKKYPIYHPSSSNNHPHPHPDSTIPSHTSVQSISSNFSKLYTNHKTLSSSKPTHKVINPHQEPSFQAISQTKHVPISSKLDSSCTTLTKSKSQHGGRFSVSTVPPKQSTKLKVVKDRVLVRVPDFGEGYKKIEKPFMKPKSEDETTQKEWKTKESIEEKIKKQDVKKAQSLLSRSYNEGFDDVKRTSVLGISGGGGRRKSFCSSQTELADFFLCNGVKVVAVDMPPFMQIHVVDCARKAHDSLEKFTARTLACTLKREFDGVYGPAWHCIVGTSFGSFVTHSVGGFMYFSMDQKLYILLFKTTVQKAV